MVQEVLYNALGTLLLHQVAAFSTSFNVPGGKEASLWRNPCLWRTTPGSPSACFLCTHDVLGTEQAGVLPPRLPICMPETEHLHYWFCTPQLQSKYSDLPRLPVKGQLQIHVPLWLRLARHPAFYESKEHKACLY